MKRLGKFVLSLCLCLLTLAALSLATEARADTVITTAAVTITAPAGGAAPSYSPSVGGSNYYFGKYSNTIFKNDIAWFDVADDAGMEVDGGAVFQSGHQYKVFAYLTASDGYTFSSATTATVNGNAAQASLTQDGQLQVEYTFPALASKPVIITQPSDVTVAAGETVTFTVVATGTGLTYRWQYKEEEEPWSDPGDPSTTGTLSFTVGADANGIKYRCIVTNSGGTTTSNAVTLSVKPGITTQPSNVTVAAGKKATFTVVATGASSYQWQYKDEGGSWANSGYSSAKTATLSFTAKADMNGRQYRCKVTNSGGTTTSSTATLTVK